MHVKYMPTCCLLNNVIQNSRFLQMANSFYLYAPSLIHYLIKHYPAIGHILYIYFLFDDITMTPAHVTSTIAKHYSKVTHSNIVISNCLKNSLYLLYFARQLLI